MIAFGRILLLLSFSLFWGGLTFYTGFAVRISHDVLNDPMDGGLITQRVTVVLQALGGVTVVLMIVNAIGVAKHSKRYGAALACIVSVLTFAIQALVVVHLDLDAVIDVNERVILDRDAFTIGHRRYNQLTTLEWLASLCYLIVTVAAWRSIDVNEPTETP